MQNKPFNAYLYSMLIYGQENRKALKIENKQKPCKQNEKKTIMRNSSKKLNYDCWIQCD